jgi:hypothetical protein
MPLNGGSHTGPVTPKWLGKWKARGSHTDMPFPCGSLHTKAAKLPSFAKRRTTNRGRSTTKKH